MLFNPFLKYYKGCINLKAINFKISIQNILYLSSILLPFN